MTEPAFTLEIEGVRAAPQIVSVEGREACSKPFHFQLVVAAEASEPRAFVARVIGGRAVLTIAGADGPARRIDGIIGDARALAPRRAPGAGPETHWYELRLRPRLWLLKKRTNHRIFQDVSLVEIVNEILDEHGIPHAWRLEGEHPGRPYWVQYGESDYRFVKRLLAEAGVFFFFEDAPAGGAGTLVLADGARAYRPLAGDAAVPFRPDFGQVHAEAVRTFSPARAMAPSAVTTDYFDYQRPGVELGSHATASHDGGDKGPDLERYDHRFERGRDEMAGDAATRRLLQERRGHSLVRAAGACRRMAPGRTFRLVDHPAGCDGEYAVRAVEHRGQQPLATGDVADLVYQNELVCDAADQPMVPRRPRRILHQVVETAIVSGPPGEEIHVDALGRIQVQFHWDRGATRTDKTSCWLRVAQPWAGSAWGSQFIPRVGMEVLVSFVGGDTDRPVVVASLYNGANPLPFALPKHKTQSGIVTRSSPGGERGNELRFEDAAGSEQVLVHAIRDLDELVEHDHTRTVHGAERVAVKEARQVKVGGDLIRVIGGNEVATINGNQVVHIAGRQLIQVDGSMTDGESAVARVKEEEPPPPPPDPEHGRMVETAELRDGALVFEIAELPPALAGLAQEVDAAARQWRDELTTLRHDAEEVRRFATLLVARAGRPNLEFVDLGGVHRATKRGERVSAELRAYQMVVAEHHDALQKVVAVPESERARAALGALARQLATEAAWLAATVAADIDGLRALYGLGPDLDGALRAGGSGAGGGGATAGFQNAPELWFLGPPDDRGMRLGVGHKNGSRMSITGGGEIDSPDGFRIASSGCFLELADGTVTLHGARVSIVAGDVTIHGGVVTITGGPIKLN